MSAYQTPTKSVPGGCFIGVLSLFPAGISLMGLWGLVKWAQLPDDKRLMDDRFWLLLGLFTGGLLLAAGAMYVAFRILRSASYGEKWTGRNDDKGVRW